MDNGIIEKSRELIDFTGNTICNHCLGRKFSDVVEADGNVLRGLKLRKALNLEEPIDECIICKDIFLKINDSLVELVKDKITYLDLEFDTFLVGSKLSEDILKNDEEINEKFNFDIEPIKKEINREVGKLLEANLKKEVEFEKQDIVVNLDFKDFLNDNIKVRVQINPIFIEGSYNKYIRTIPQTKWPCRKCKGKGCEECNFTGKQYLESVEELISELALKYFKGYTAKFHGAGREDIDVLMLGDGRPFVLEIKEPKLRNVDLKKLETEVNLTSENKTAYHNLKYVDRGRKAEIKVTSPDTFKVYKALVKCDEEFDVENLENLKNLNQIEQYTPTRVEHRRAKKIRTKNVKNLETNLINSKEFELIVKTDGGLYIKELISGDDKRTKPSISEILGVNCICAQLDVIAVSEK